MLPSMKLLLCASMLALTTAAPGPLTYPYDPADFDPALVPELEIGQAGKDISVRDNIARPKELNDLQTDLVKEKKTKNIENMSNLVKDMEALKTRMGKMELKEEQMHGSEEDELESATLEEIFSNKKTLSKMSTTNGREKDMQQQEKLHGDLSMASNHVIDEDIEHSSPFLLGSSTVQVVLGSLLMLVIFMGLGFACCYFCSKSGKGYARKKAIGFSSKKFITGKLNLTKKPGPI